MHQTLQAAVKNNVQNKGSINVDLQWEELRTITELWRLMCSLISGALMSG